MQTVQIRNSIINHNGKRPDFWKQAAEGQWESNTFDVFDKYVVPGKIVIDIGAWNGVCSLYCASLGAKCHAIEPDSGVWVELMENIQHNPGLAISHHPFGISNINWRMHINSATPNGFGNSESSIVDRANLSIAISKEIQVYTLENFIQCNRIDIKDVCLIKMDIEAGELLVLPQIEPFLTEHKPTMFVSFHPGWFPNGNEDIQMLCDIIFPIYNVMNSAGIIHSEAEFKKSLVDYIEHSFILEAKA